MLIKKNHLLGLFLALAVSFIAQFLAIYLPKFGAESIAMILGIILGNLVFTNERYESGVKWAEKYPIEMGIALLGATLTFNTITKLGFQAVLFVIINMTLTIIFVYFLGKHLFKVDFKSRLLMAAGNAVCGSSAISGVAPAIGASDSARRTSTATVSLTGMALLFTLPSIAPKLFNGNNFLSGALVGETVQSVGQVVGTASLINGQVVTYATLFKLMRVILLAAVVIIFARIARKKGTVDVDTNKRSSLLPWYIIAFLLLITFNSILPIPKGIQSVIHQISNFFGVVNLAAIGLNLKWITIKKSGPKFISYGLVIGVLQVILAFTLIKILL